MKRKGLQAFKNELWRIRRDKMTKMASIIKGAIQNEIYVDILLVLGSQSEQDQAWTYLQVLGITKENPFIRVESATTKPTRPSLRISFDKVIF